MNRINALILSALVLFAGSFSYAPLVYSTISEVSARDEYTGNASTIAFTYNFQISDETHIDVYLAAVLQTLTTHYTVAGVDSATGTITFVTAPGSGVAVTLLRDQPIEQQSNYVTNEGFPSSRVEGDYDLLAMSIQMNAEEIDRALKFNPESTDGPDVFIPDLVIGKYLRVDSAGTGIEMADGSIQLVTNADVAAAAAIA